MDDDLDQLFPGFRALILAEISQWRDYDLKLNPGALDSFNSAVAGHRDRYRAKLELLKFENADSRKQLDQIEKEVVKFANRVIADAADSEKIEFDDAERKSEKPIGQKVWAAYRAIGKRRSHFDATHVTMRRKKRRG